MMKVLLACEESQIVCTEFRKLGFSAYSCDLQKCSGNHPEWHIQEDVSKVINDNWKLIIAFPPCTHLAASGARWFKEKQKDGRQQSAIEFFLQFTKLNCQHVAIENPIGIMSRLYKRPDQIIHPFIFGDPFSKQTCLWLKNLPKLHQTKITNKGEFIHFKRKGESKNVFFKEYNYTIVPQPYWYASIDRNSERGKLRSKTFPGIAKAMAEQWGKHILHYKPKNKFF